MTREEAMEILEEVSDLDDSIYAYNQEYGIALRMAINALQGHETTLEKVANDYGLTVDGVSFALDQYQTVLCNITHNRMSKLGYYADDILRLVDNVQCEGCELMEEQKPRVMSVEDIKWLENGHVVWIEFSDGRLLPFIVEDGCLMRWRSLWRICEEAFHDEDYEARAWSSRPSDKLRGETPWN